MDLFSKRLLAWYDSHGRHDLPWQCDPTPYRVWVSEVMLQQTQVSTVIPYFERFMARFSDVISLADASVDEVLAHWSGLGYYSRARNLHKAARVIRDDFRGVFPAELETVMGLPGIGRSTAGAILSLACSQRHAILDGNVKRVLSRFHAVGGWYGKREVEQQLWRLAESHTPKRRCGDYTQAIMDLGATLCTRSRPNCQVCPVAADCTARQLDRVTDFPGKKPRRVLPLKRTKMLLLQNTGGEWLLERRPPSGIWGGLWSLPECPHDENVEAWCRDKMGLKVMETGRWPVLLHTFSHFQLEITPVLAQAGDPTTTSIMEPAATLWYKTQSFNQLGLPTPVKKLLQRLADSNEE